MCVCSPPASVLTSFVCFLSHCQKNTGSKSVFLVAGLPSWFSSVWGIHESHEYSGKVPELVPLTLINIYTGILYPTVDTYGVLKYEYAFLDFSHDTF